MASVELLSPPSTADPLCFIIKAATLKFDTRDDILPYLKPLIESADVEEVHLGGNTYGIEACKFLGEILATKKNLKVRLRDFPSISSCSLRVFVLKLIRRLLSLRISSRLVSAQRSPSLLLTFLLPFLTTRNSIPLTSRTTRLDLRPKNPS